MLKSQLRRFEFPPAGQKEKLALYYARRRPNKGKKDERDEMKCALSLLGGLFSRESSRFSLSAPLCAANTTRAQSPSCQQKWLPRKMTFGAERKMTTEKKINEMHWKKNF